MRLGIVIYLTDTVTVWNDFRLKPNTICQSLLLFVLHISKANTILVLTNSDRRVRFTPIFLTAL